MNHAHGAESCQPRRRPSPRRALPPAGPGATRAVAGARKAGLDALTRPEGYIAHNFGAGFDISRYPREALLSDVLDSGDPGTETVSRFKYDAGMTIGDIYAQYRTVDQGMPFCCGTPGEVADHMQAAIADMDLDGFLLRQTSTPGTVRDFADHVMPILQARGVYRRDYEGESLRETLCGQPSARGAADHAAAAFRPGGG